MNTHPTSSSASSPARQRSSSHSPYYTDPDPNCGGLFQSMTAHPVFWGISPEQLRVNHYALNTSLVGSKLSEPRLTLNPDGTVNISFPFQVSPIRLTKASTCPTTPFGINFVTFRVGGESGKDFTVHENLAESRSEFVKLALRGRWNEAQTRVITLPEDEPLAFQTWRNYIYAGIVHSNHYPQFITQQYRTLIQAYALGERLVDSDFKAAVISNIIVLLHKKRAFDFRLSNLVYDNLPDGSPLRRLWVDIYVWLGRAEWLDETRLGEEIHRDFLKDLTVRQMGFPNKQRPKLAPFMTGVCAYHEHTEASCDEGRIERSTVSGGKWHGCGCLTAGSF